MLLKVVSYSVMYWYMCRLDAGCCHRVVNKDSRFVTFHFAVLVVVPVDARFVVVSVHHVLVFA